MSLAPVIVFAYNRPSHLKQTLDSLQKNYLFEDTKVFIFCDGPKENCSEDNLKLIKETQDIAKKNSNSIVRISKQNQGLAKSIIKGVTEIINEFGSVIVLEDDIITGKYFLKFMNDSLNKYKNNKEVWHITGWHEPTNFEDGNNSFFYPLMDCWSWGTWQDRWNKYKKNPEELISSYTKKMIHEFNVDGLVPNKWNQVIGNYIGVNNTWAIFWYATILKNKGLCLAPANSLVKNVGFDNTGVHSKKSEERIIITDINHQIINYPDVFNIDKKQYNIIKEYYKKIYKMERLLNLIKSFIPKKMLYKYSKYKRGIK